MSAVIPRCQVLPLPDHQVTLQIDGVEHLRWHHGPNYPRPFFYPLRGPSGSSLTRMGHPGAPDHDHHRSIWFAHAKVLGLDFWSDTSRTRIRQKQWLLYEDGDQEAILAVLLGWYDGHDPKELLEQQLIVAVRPGPEGETLLELQATFRPMADSLECGKTNFGFLAVRVAKNLSEHFGGGKLTSSSGVAGEPAIFGKPAKWIDYSGPVPGGSVEGITFVDHASNPGSPVSWHVREDGWMGAAPCMHGPHVITKAQPLTLRYLLHGHRGGVNPIVMERVVKEFDGRSNFVIGRSKRKHQQYQIRRQ